MRSLLLCLAPILAAQTPVSEGFLQFPTGEEIGALSAVAIGKQDRIINLENVELSDPKVEGEETAGGGGAANIPRLR